MRGFVLNKFRGDAALLPPAPQRVAALTGVETLGVIPWLEHGLPDEDGAADPSRSTGSGFRVAVVRYPTASNLDEFKPLEQVAQLRWATRREDLDADLVVLPGSKHVVADLNWLRRRNLDRGVLARAAAGLPVLGICGGMQMLGTSMVDGAGVDGDGLGLLPLETTFRATKLAAAVETRFAALPGPWSLLTGQTVSGYEIRHGESVATGPVVPALSARRGFVAGPVLGVSVHGLFENAAVVAALVGRVAERTLDVVFDDLADAVEEHLNVGFLLREAGVG